MLTPVRVAAAVALLTIGAGVALTSQLAPTGDPGSGPAVLDASPLPSAGPSASPTSVAALFRGTVPGSGCAGPAARTTEGGVIRQRGWRCGPSQMTTDDPRFGGTVRSTLNDDVYFVGASDYSVMTTTISIRNDDGSWLCSNGQQVGQGMGVNSTQAIGDESLTCTGDGAYAGLSAIYVDDWSTDPVTVTGFIFPGAVPPLPDPAPGA